MDKRWTLLLELCPIPHLPRLWKSTLTEQRCEDQTEGNILASAVILVRAMIRAHDQCHTHLVIDGSPFAGSVTQT